MAKDVVGTPQSITIDGQTFDLHGEANPTDNSHLYDNEAVPTSNPRRNLQQKKRKMQDFESVDIVCNVDEYEQLKQLNDSNMNYPMAMKMVEGSIYRTTGFIRIDSGRDSEEGKCTLILKHSTGSGWQLYAA